MKFPKSLHADGWSNHIDTTPSDKPAVKAGGIGARPHLAKPASVTPSLSTTPPLTATAATATPRVEPAVHAQPRTAALPPQRANATNWWIAAGAGAAVIAGVGIWAMNRPADTTPLPAVLSSAEPPTQVADATPVEPAPAADRDTTTTTTEAATPAPAEPAPERLGPPLTTVKPAPEAARVAQAPAPVPAPRPDLVVRSNPRTAALQPLQPPVTVAAAPAAIEPPPATVQPGTAPIVVPPTAAGPATVTPPVVTPPAVIPPVAATTPETAASAALPVTPPLAQAPALPTPEDSGITVKVRSALAADATLAAVPIAVSTDHGVVKLEGQAPDAPTRERATVVAASAMGVKAVDNRLTLPPATVVSQAPSGQ